MPNGNPDPNCTDCKGRGTIPMPNWDVDCDCVNQVEKLFEINQEFRTKDIPYKIPIIPNQKILKRMHALQLTTEYIADGILTWCTWPGIEGHNCEGCGEEMNVLGMSYGHWCPVCDPDDKHSHFHLMNHMGRKPYDYPAFGPSIDTIREGSRLARERENNNEQRRIR